MLNVTTKGAGKIVGLEVGMSTNQLQQLLSLRFDGAGQRRKIFGIRPTFGRIYPWIGWWCLWCIGNPQGITNSVQTTFDQKSSTTSSRIQERKWSLSNDRKDALQRLKDAAEKRKQRPFWVTSTQISFCHLSLCQELDLFHLEMTLGLVLNSTIFDLIFVERQSSSSSSPFRCRLSDIDEVILVGGPPVSLPLLKPLKLNW